MGTDNGEGGLIVGVRRSRIGVSTGGKGGTTVTEQQLIKKFKV